jgi:hypothetical protein
MPCVYLKTFSEFDAVMESSKLKVRPLLSASSCASPLGLPDLAEGKDAAILPLLKS